MGPLSLVLTDLDGFAEVNDYGGYAVGVILGHDAPRRTIPQRCSLRAAPGDRPIPATRDT
jgi:predicted signal transduction protein with EAL and GGDEF domain